MLHLLVVFVVFCVDHRQDVDLIRHFPRAVVEVTHHGDDERVRFVGIFGVLRMQPHVPRDEHISREERVSVPPVQHCVIRLLFSSITDRNVPRLFQRFKSSLDVLRGKFENVETKWAMRRR